MTNIDRGTLSVAELVEEFIALGIKQHKAVWNGDTKTYSPLFERMQATKVELENRPGDQRLALKPLYEHQNIQVRLMAARSTLALAPIEARGVIESIAASNQFPCAGDAGVCLYMLDSGAFVPS